MPREAISISRESTDRPRRHGIAVQELLGSISDKWSLLIVRNLSIGPRRFNELKRDIGPISPRMLTQALKRLEKNALVSRTVLPTVPPRVDYALTSLGTTLAIPVNALVTWAYQHKDEIEAGRRRAAKAEDKAC